MAVHWNEKLLHLNMRLLLTGQQYFSSQFSSLVTKESVPQRKAEEKTVVTKLKSRAFFFSSVFVLIFLFVCLVLKISFIFGISLLTLPGNAAGDYHLFLAFLFKCIHAYIFPGLPEPPPRCLSSLFSCTLGGAQGRHPSCPILCYLFYPRQSPCYVLVLRSCSFFGRICLLDSFVAIGNP